MKIVEKIKALLAKASGTDNEAEAEIFFAKAYELMEKHQLDITDLESEDPMGEEIGVSAKGRGGVDWNERLMFPVARYYGCKAIQQHRGRDVHMVLVGRQSARITAIEMHKYLVKTVRRLGRERCQEMGLKPEQAARRIGVALSSRINSLCPKPKEPSTQAGRNALVTLDALSLWLEKNYPDLTPIKGASMTNSLARDIAAGIGLNRQAGHSEQRMLKMSTINERPAEPQGENAVWYRGWEAGWEEMLDFFTGEGYRAYKGGADLGAPDVRAGTWEELLDAIDEEEDDA